MAKQYNDQAFYTSNNCRNNYKNKVLELYEEATEIADESLNPAHPVRLYIANCYSKFVSGLFDNDDEALKIASEAYNNVLPHLPNLNDSLKGPAETQLQYLKENIKHFS